MIILGSPTRGTEKAPKYLETEFLLRHFSSSRKKAQKMYEDFVLAGIGMGCLGIRPCIVMCLTLFVGNVTIHGLSPKVPEKSLIRYASQMTI
ncbi:MAG: hypothetical protein MUP08_00975 [Desulfobulbaceae bacterium]|nr:hypothetical protein [Desulfobulbaceae bacterium]